MYLKNLMGDVLIGGRFRSVAGALKFAVSSGVCLDDVDLRNSNLAGVDLDGVSMRRACAIKNIKVTFIVTSTFIRFWFVYVLRGIHDYIYKIG